MKTGIELIADERKEQIEKHGYAQNESGQLAYATEMLLAAEHEEGIDPLSYPYKLDHETCQKMLAKPYRERLIIAGALIAAELDRINNENEL